MKSKQLRFIASILLGCIFFSCGRTTEDLQYEQISDYIPLQVGKYITYRLDSTVFTNFGTIEEVHSYQEKQIVDAQFLDASGRTSYRITRYLRDFGVSQPWAPAGTFAITPAGKTIEVIENNLRVIRLAMPIKVGTMWKGNTFLPSRPYASLYSFNNDVGMEKWDYTIDSVNTILKINNNIYNNVVKVSAVYDINVADTLDVAGNQIQISEKAKTIYLRGNATSTINIMALPPKTTGVLTIYNRSNRRAKLGNINIPVDAGKSFDYINNAWTYGFVDAYGVRKDTTYFDLPFGYKTILAENYSKSIGLVSQLHTMWEYQFDLAKGAGHKVGFEVKRTIVDHN